jgi:hypothetical protein
MNPKEKLAFYRAVRAICGPPMIRIGRVDFGELWFYDSGSFEITACLSERSVLVAYDCSRSREEVIAGFRSAHEWLESQSREESPRLHLVVAIREDLDGGLIVKESRLGDWSGLLRYDTLPPSFAGPDWLGYGE